MKQIKAVISLFILALYIIAMNDKMDMDLQNQKGGYNNGWNDCLFMFIDIIKKQPYKKPVFKLTKFEKELLECYSDECSFKLFNSLNVMKEKGYFKGVDEDETIEDILAKSEVVG